MGKCKPTVISTFAGCGGSSLGYKLAGYKELLAVEWDDNAVATFKLNFPEVPVYHGDIGELTSTECMRLAGISKGELDVLDGSPPCQGFSTAGKRKFDDPRNSLFKEYARLVRDLQPKVFVMENVIGMVRGHMKQAYLQIIKTLRECGYSAKGEVLNAMYYNVPQSRERVIIIGVRNDLLQEPSHPQPQTKPITILEAWKDVENTDSDIANATIPEQYAVNQVAQKLGPGQSPRNIGIKNFFGIQRLMWNKPLPTACASIGNLSTAGLLHPNGKRRPTVPELKAASSYPAEFKFLNFKSAWKCIGNSVPPNLMAAIAQHIEQYLHTVEATA